MQMFSPVIKPALSEHKIHLIVLYNSHVKAVKNIIPATDSAALFVTDVAVPPCPVPALDMISSKNTQTSAIPEFTNAMAETIVGTIDFFFTD